MQQARNASFTRSSGSWRAVVATACNPIRQRKLWCRSITSASSPQSTSSPSSPCMSDVCGFTRPDMLSRKKLKFKCHDAHVFIGTGPVASSSAEEEWGKRFERTDLGHLYKEAVKSSKPKKGTAQTDECQQIKVSACDAPEGTVFIFPHWLQFSNVQATPQHADAIVRAAFDLTSNQSHLNGTDTGVTCKDGQALDVKPASKDAFVFVCCHGARDARCGECGPPLVHGIKDLLDKSTQAPSAAAVAVHKCSHIGGHVYAGNVVVFRQRETAKTAEVAARGVCGDWYGYMDLKTLPHLVATQLAGNASTKSALAGPLAELWRGCMGFTQSEIEEERRRHGVVDV